MIYLDNAATTMIKPEAVARAMTDAMRRAASPGRGGHVPAMTAAEIVFRCRENASELFNVPEPERIVFTMNATHALNIAIRSLAHEGTRVLVSGYEHNSVTRPLAQLGVDLVVVLDRAQRLDGAPHAGQLRHRAACGGVGEHRLQRAQPVDGDVVALVPDPPGTLPP